MSYRNAVNYLASKTKAIELCNQFGGRVVVCPEWNGRVMTSTCGGLDSSSFGFINVHGIETDGYKSSGGEDHIIIPSCSDEGSFTVDSVPPDPKVRMRRSIQMTNSEDVPFNLDIVRTVKLLEAEGIAAVFGQIVSDVLENDDVSFVGFMTDNTLVHSGGGHNTAGGTVSICIRSTFNSGQDTVAVLPFREGEKEELGPNINTDYFGAAPHAHLRTLGNTALLRTDGTLRCQIGVSRKRALPFTGSIDFREGVLTLQTFNISDEHYSGEVIRIYNHGSPLSEELTASFYEFDFFSPEKELIHSESVTHQQHTLHINADNKVLAFLAEQVLGVNYTGAFEKMLT